MSDVTELQRSMMQTLFDTYGDDEIAVCDAYAEAERAGKVARPEEDRGEFTCRLNSVLWVRCFAMGLLSKDRHGG